MKRIPLGNHRSGATVRKRATSKLQMWENSLAVRIPAQIARAARLSPGQKVEISVTDVGVSIVPVEGREMSLSERLEQFDPALHGGESMPVRRVGREAV